MPFDPPSPLSFSESYVRAYAPRQPGVYGLSNAGAWLHIGQTRDIQESLLEHLVSLTDPLLSHRPTGFVFEICAEHLCAGRKRRLLQEYPLRHHTPPRHL